MIPRLTWPLLAFIYTASIVLANVLTSHYGLVAVAPGLKATAGTFAVGGVIMTRDLLQDAAGRRVVLACIVVGAALSFATSSERIALASGLTFLVAELAEFAVYTPLRARVEWGGGRWSGVVTVANVTGIVADTLLFLAIAGFPLAWSTVAGQMVGKAYVTAAVIFAAVVIRHAVSQPAIQPADT